LAELIRTFIALEMPLSVKEIAGKLQNDLRAKFQCRIGWTRPEGMHLTMKFLGDTDEGIIEDLANALQDAVKEFAPMDFTISQPGHFGGRNPRVIWLGLSAPETLITLQKEIENAAHKFGFPLEERPFHPHITLGRVKDTNGMKGMLAHLKKIPIQLGSFKVDELILFKSDLLPSGAVYTRLKTIMLK